MWRRCLTTKVGNPREAIRELKRHVHRLYKHIHPDRLGQFPKHRAVNEASFQVLQAALDRHFDRVEARTGDAPPQAYQGPQQLVFFAQASSSTVAEGEEGSNGLRKAEVKFHESNLGQGLHKLFESLGLEPPPKSILPGLGKGTFGEGQEFTSLTELVKHARHVIMTNVKKQHANATTSTQSSGLQDEVLVTRLALQRSRGVNVTLGPGLPSNEKLALVFRRLARTLAQARNAELRNLIVEIDGGFDVSLNTEGVHPWITLGACASGETWVNSLCSEEVVAACANTKRRMDKVTKLESLAASALGVKLVLHNILILDVTDEVGTSSESLRGAKLETMLAGSVAFEQYEKVLQQLVHETQQHVTDSADALDSVVLMIEEGSRVDTDAEEGIVRIGLETGVEGILSALNKHGKNINETFKRLNAMREAEQNLVNNVKRAVAIDGLRRGEGLSDKQWSDALAHMRAQAGKLRGILDGVPVVIGHHARLLVESGEVEVPHDFYRSIRF